MIRLPCRPVRYALLLALPATALLTPATPASASASVVNLNCAITVTTDLHPGLTPQPQHVAFTSHGLTGAATCTGTVSGQPVTGPGTFAIDSQDTVSGCTEATGAGSFVLQIPVTGGTATVTGRFTSTSTHGSTVVAGDLAGTATVISVVGDCVTTPITRATTVFLVQVT
jgi:hypothetical protein